MSESSEMPSPPQTPKTENKHPIKKMVTPVLVAASTLFGMVTNAADTPKKPDAQPTPTPPPAQVVKPTPTPFVEIDQPMTGINTPNATTIKK